MEKSLSNRTPVRGTGPGHVVAIELGAQSIRAVEVENGADGSSRILKRGQAALPPNVWNDLGANRDAVIAALKEALANGGIVAKTVAASLPRRHVTVRFARLPHAPPEALRGMVAFEAQQYILFSLDEVVLDFYALSDPLPGYGSSGDDMITVLLAAARRSLIEEVMICFDRAGLDLHRLTVSALALAEQARDAIEPTALIDIEPGEIDFAVVADGQLLFTRASALDIHNAQPDVGSRRLVEEVSRSFTAFQNEFRSKPITHVFLCGPDGAGPDGARLEQGLTDALEMPVARLHNRVLTSSDPDARIYATAVGVALQERGDGIAPINLVPSERFERQAAQTRRKRQNLAAVGAAALALLGVVGFQRYLKAQADLNTKTIAANSTLDTTTKQYDVKKKEFDKLDALDKETSRGLTRKHPVVDVVTAVNAALPRNADLWLTQFSFERGANLTIHGETKSETAATDLVLALQGSGAFTQVRLTYLGDAVENANARSAATAPAANRPGTTVTPAAATVAPTTPAPPAAPGAARNAVTGTRPAASKPKTPAAPKTDKKVYTSFIITCRVNPRANDLVPVAMAAASGKPMPIKKSSVRRAPGASATDSMDDAAVDDIIGGDNGQP